MPPVHTMTSPICSHCSLMGILFYGIKNGTWEPLDRRKRSWSRHDPINTKKVMWGNLALPSCASSGPGILWPFQRENERDFVLGYPWSITTDTEGGASLFSLADARILLCAAPGGWLGTGERGEGQAAGMAQSGNTALMIWIISDLIYALFHIVPT